MAASRAKVLARRKKAKELSATVKLVQPMEALSMDSTPIKIKSKIRVPAQKSALIPSEGRSMGMDID